MLKNLIFCLSIFLICCNTSKPQEKSTIAVGQILTPQGEMLFRFHEGTSKHQESFVKLAEENYWDTLSFNRVIEGFVIQGGCPDTPEGFADSPYLLKPEFDEAYRHVYGAVGAGRDGNPEKLSAGCQFYIVHAKEGLARLDGDYTIFGQVFAGLEVLDQIATTATDSLDEPLDRVSLDVNILYLTAEELAQRGFQL